MFPGFLKIIPHFVGLPIAPSGPQWHNLPQTPLAMVGFLSIRSPFALDFTPPPSSQARYSSVLSQMSSILLTISVWLSSQSDALIRHRRRKGRERGAKFKRIFVVVKNRGYILQFVLRHDHSHHGQQIQFRLFVSLHGRGRK